MSIFFKPNKKFVEWLTKYANGRLIIDVGCGEGQLLDALHKVGYPKILGIDALAEQKQMHKFLQKGINIVPMMAERFSLVKGDGHLLVIARPCHGGFTENVLKANGGNEILYIGLPKNLDEDIPPDFMAIELEEPTSFYRDTSIYLVVRKTEMQDKTKVNEKLEKIKHAARAVCKNENNPKYKAAVILLSSEETASIDGLAELTGYPKTFISKVSRHLRNNKVWRKKELGGRLKYVGARDHLEFLLHVNIALGLVTRVLKD